MVISFMLKLVKEAYKKEKNKTLCERIYFGRKL
jgi:hypothetical protein